MSAPTGTTSIDEEGWATLTFLRAYRHRPEHVWQAISTPEGLSQWLMCSRAEIEPREGGRIELVSGPAQYLSTGVIRVWEPPRVLEYEWNVAPVPEMPSGERAVFRYELSWDGTVTRLVVIYRRLTVRTARGFVVGVHAFLERLEAQLDGVPMPDFLVRLESLRAQYPAWSHDETPTGQ